MHRDPDGRAGHRTHERGQTMAEYAIVLAVITLGILLTIQRIGDSAGALVQRVADVLA